MNRMTLARRYGPLLAVAAVQLLIIAVVPSKAPTAASLTAGPGLDGGGGLDNTASGDAGTGAVGPGGSDTTGTGAGGVGGGGAGGAGGAGGTGAKANFGGGGGASTAAAGYYPLGDVTHCVDGRNHDPKIDFYAPPCQGKFTGKNAGATYDGVTADTINITDYAAKGNAAVDAILQAQGAYEYLSQRQKWDKNVEDFINTHYELWGRKVKINIFQGQCDSVPPDYRCLRNEVRQLIQQQHPFVIKWNTSLASPFFAEASAAKVVNVGGWHFRDSFNKAWSPYHWDVQISGTQSAKQFGEYYCAALNGKPAKYAGEPVYAGEASLQTKIRDLGVISTNDPENKKAITEDLSAALAKCGAKYTHEYYYAQDISTATQQRQAGLAAMENGPNGRATSVLCFCDLVAPAFVYQTEEEDHYHPENLIAGTGFMDADKAAQVYDNQFPGDKTSGCRCNHEYVNAFGLAQTTTQEPLDKDVAARVYKALGKPIDRDPSRKGPSAETNNPFGSAGQDWEYWNMIGTLLQQAGPTLDPAHLQFGAFHTAPRGGGGHIQRSFENDWSWNDDMRQVYWSETRPTTYDNTPGSYVDLFPGKRFLLGGYGGELSLPPKTADSYAGKTRP